MKKIIVNMYISKTIYKDDKGKVLNEKELEFLESEELPFTEEFKDEVQETHLIFNTLPLLAVHQQPHAVSGETVTCVESVAGGLLGESVFYLKETPEEFYNLIQEAEKQELESLLTSYKQ